MIPSRCQILYALENHIGVFMDIFIYESARRIGDQNALRKVDALMDWSLVLSLLKRGLNRSGLGPQGYDEIVLFKCLLIGNEI
jgi:transposase, IS5 family